MSENETNATNGKHIAPGDKKQGIKLVAPARADERAGEIRFVDMPREKQPRLDVLVLNPPSPDGDLFLRDIARVGRRTRDGIIWPQTALAQIGAVVQQRVYRRCGRCHRSRKCRGKISSATCTNTSRAT